MTTPPPQPPQPSRPSTHVVRRVARLVALLPALAVLAMASSAVAEPPEQWDDNPAVSALHTLLVIVLIPAGLFVLILLLVYVPSMSKGQHYQPGSAWRGEPTWFGGPRGGADEVEAAQPSAALEAGSGSSEEQRGGGSGRW